MYNIGHFYKRIPFSCLTVSLLLMGFLPKQGRCVDEWDPSFNIVGLPAPEWQVRDWINSGPLSLEGLRGKVVLIR